MLGHDGAGDAEPQADEEEAHRDVTSRQSVVPTAKEKPRKTPETRSSTKQRP